MIQAFIFQLNRQKKRMQITTRRHFITGMGISAMGVPINGHLFGKKENLKDRFQVGIQEYTFNRWLKSGN